MSKILPDSPFNLDVVIYQKHYVQSRLIRSQEIASICNNTTALAIREALQQQAIPHDEVYAVIDPDFSRVRFTIWLFYNDESWHYQADLRDYLSLITALQRNEDRSLKLSFIRCNSPVKLSIFTQGQYFIINFYY